MVIMSNDISSNYVDITYTVDEIHAMGKILHKVRNELNHNVKGNDENLISFIDKTLSNDFLWDED